MNFYDWLRSARQVIDALDARLLLEHVTGYSHAEIIAAPETLLTAGQEEELARLCQRRQAGEPIAYLLGRTCFMGLDLEVSPDVLVPRPETEELVEIVISKAADLPQPRILDLGTGSGAIPIALAKNLPHAQLTAVDVSPAALALARKNGERHGLPICWQESHWFSALTGQRFHLIVSNPPYIHPEDTHLAGDGLRFEPRTALTDGEDGLSCIRHIIKNAPEYLEPGGWLIFEHGWDQGEAVRNLLTLTGFKEEKTWSDLGGHERITAARWIISKPTPLCNTD